MSATAGPDQLEIIRRAEIDATHLLLQSSARVLDLGAGGGVQARRLHELGYDVEAVDLPEANASPAFPVRTYDGQSLPWPGDSFDAVYSWNVLEHVHDLYRLHGEIRRVVRPGGLIVHVLPTHVWRVWTTLTCVPAISRPRRHGVRGNLISEHWTYRPAWWRAHFRDAGFDIVEDRPVGYFYTGNLVWSRWLSLADRRLLASLLGSACRVYVLREGRSPRPHPPRR